jgi:hypothetical protein
MTDENKVPKISLDLQDALKTTWQSHNSTAHRARTAR